MPSARHAFAFAVLLAAALTDSTRANAGGPLDDPPVADWRGLSAGCDNSTLFKGAAVLHLSKQKPNHAVNLTRLHVSPSKTWKLGDGITEDVKTSASSGEVVTSHSWVSIPFTASKGEYVSYQRLKGSAEGRVHICEYYRKKSSASWGDFNENDLVAGDSQAFIAGSKLGSESFQSNFFPDKGPRDKSGLVDSKIIVVVMIQPTADITTTFKLKALR